MIQLDTNVVIAYFNGNESVSGRMQTEIDRITLSALVVCSWVMSQTSCKSRYGVRYLQRK